MLAEDVSHPDEDWYWDGLSEHLKVTVEDVLAHPDKPWDWKLLSRNFHMSFDDVFKHPHLPWNWDELSIKLGAWRACVARPNLPWNWGMLSGNFGVSHSPNCAAPGNFCLECNARFKILPGAEISVDFVADNRHLSWDWNTLSGNRRLTIRDVVSHPDLPWNWSILSRHSMTLSDILAHTTMPWDWDEVSANRSVTWEAIVSLMGNPCCDWRRLLMGRLRI